MPDTLPELDSSLRVSFEYLKLLDSQEGASLAVNTLGFSVGRFLGDISRRYSKG